MHISDEQRRIRLARRQALHPDHRLDAPEAVAQRLAALHATEAATVHLAVAARTRQSSVADVERALAIDRTIVKQLAMRRTLWAFPRALLPAVWGSAAARVADQQRGRLQRDLEKHGITDDGAAWLEQARDTVLDRLADGSALSTRQLREQLPHLDARTIVIPGSRWTIPGASFLPQVLTLLGAEALIVRGESEGHWRLGRHRWLLTEKWLGERPAASASRQGYAQLVRGWLAAFGPGTEADLVWWLGATKGVARTALADVDGVPVQLDSGAIGYVLPGDDVLDEPVGTPWAALLPTLDPTLMGWRERDFYLDPALVPYLFDTNGNGGTTAWVNGRVVGCWVHDDDGSVKVLPARELSSAERDLVQAEAERLTRFLDGAIITNVYKSRMMKGEPLP